MPGNPGYVMLLLLVNNLVFFVNYKVIVNYRLLQKARAIRKRQAVRNLPCRLLARAVLPNLRKYYYFIIVIYEYWIGYYAIDFLLLHTR